jgi:hypothetical protein
MRRRPETERSKSRPDARPARGLFMEETRC